MKIFMKKISLHFCIIALLLSFSLVAQNIPERKKIKVTGTIIEKISKQPLEYATIAFINQKNPKIIGGGITNAKGEFDVDIPPGIYTIKAEFISFKPTEIKSKEFLENTLFGVIALDEDATQLNEIEVRAEKSTVEIKLDKKVYNVGQDMIVKGGTASDVLDNVPSVTVDGDGNVSLRGNDNVKILIDGKPSNAINIADALRTISADALDKIEVITNPSARYDAEGSAGIINIILKKGKNNGTNGSIVGTIGDPRNYGLNGTINYKSTNFNLFSTLGYTDSNSPGNSRVDANYLNADGTIQKTINDRVNSKRARNGFNYNFGIDLFLDQTTTWTNSLSYRKSNGSNPINDLLYNYEGSNFFIRNRFNDQFTRTNEVEYASSFTKKFKRDGHKLSIEFNFSRDNDNDFSTITDRIVGSTDPATIESAKNLQSQNKDLAKLDYVLPIGKNSQFEAGYKGDFNTLLTNYSLGSLDGAGNYTPNYNYTNTLEYKEKINAFYTQFGSKINKFSYLLGIRYEDSNIDINLLSTQEFNNKHYHNFFPSAFLNYQISEVSTLSLNYSKRIARPRNRFINPFSNYTSNVNIFQGNPDINPSLTDAVDLGFMTKWNKLTLTTSLYVNQTKDVFTFIRRPNGATVISSVDGVEVQTPVYLSTPINLAKEQRVGFEFNLNYSPYKWWRLNGNFNAFQVKTTGNYSYILENSNQVVNENFDNSAFTWFVRLSSKITLPYKIDWQLNGTYNAPQNNAQGKSLGVASANSALSKDVLKDKGTISLNVSDIFNSRKRISETHLPTLDSYNEMQWRTRQINLSFTYRFNTAKKPEKERTQKTNDSGNEDFPG